MYFSSKSLHVLTFLFLTVFCSSVTWSVESNEGIEEISKEQRKSQSKLRKAERKERRAKKKERRRNEEMARLVKAPDLFSIFDRLIQASNGDLDVRASLSKFGYSSKQKEILEETISDLQKRPLSEEIISKEIMLILLQDKSFRQQAQLPSRKKALQLMQTLVDKELKDVVGPSKNPVVDSTAARKELLEGMQNSITSIGGSATAMKELFAGMHNDMTAMDELCTEAQTIGEQWFIKRQFRLSVRVDRLLAQIETAKKTLEDREIEEQRLETIKPKKGTKDAQELALLQETSETEGSIASSQKKVDDLNESLLRTRESLDRIEENLEFLNSNMESAEETSAR